jgi:uncharacterized Fe-S cluster-containing radical SAM superfamily protein
VFVCGTVGRSVGCGMRCVVCWTAKRELAAMGMERGMDVEERRGVG